MPKYRNVFFVLILILCYILSDSIISAHVPGEAETTSAAQRLLHEGHHKYSDGDYISSLEIFKHLSIDENNDPKTRIDAARMHAQIELIHNKNYKKSIKLYENLNKLAVSLLSDKHSIANYQMQSFEKRGAIYSEIGKHDESGKIYEKLMQLSNNNLEMKLVALHGSTKGYMKANNFQNATRVIDTFLENKPNYGQADGRIVELLMLKALATGIKPNSPKRADLLKSVWSAILDKPYLQKYNVGRELVHRLLENNRNSEAISIGLSLHTMLQESYKLIPEEKLRYYSISESYQQILLETATALILDKQPELALKIFRDLNSLFPAGLYDIIVNKKIEELDKVYGINKKLFDISNTTELNETVSKKNNANTIGKTNTKKNVIKKNISEDHLSTQIILVTILVLILTIFVYFKKIKS